MSKRILIVDDEPNILMSLDFLMKKNGYEVFVARNGQEAIEIIDAQNIDLVVLDIMMPEVDGYEVCQYIRSSPDNINTRVIFLSAKVKEEEIQKGYGVGADCYVTKPFSTRELIKKVNELMLP